MLSVATVAGEVVRRWAPPMLPGVEVLHFSGTLPSRPFIADPYTLILSLSGGYQVRHRGTLEQGGPDSLALCQPDEVYCFEWPREQAAVHVLYIDAGELARAAQRLGRPQGPLLFSALHARSPEVLDTVRQLHALLEEPTGREAEVEACYARLLEALIVHCMGDPSPQCALRPERAAVRQARELLDGRSDGSVSLSELALQAGLSPFHLLRLFRDEVGMPPHGYQLQMRLHEARRLLKRGMGPGDVALQVGFADQSHLNRHFKKLFLITPAQYARACGDRPPRRNAAGLRAVSQGLLSSG